MRLRIISWETLEKLRREEDVLIIDLREQEEYEREHIAGALWADWERLEEEMPRYLEKRGRAPRWIILYCDRGNTGDEHQWGISCAGKDGADFILKPMFACGRI